MNAIRSDTTCTHVAFSTTKSQPVRFFSTTSPNASRNRGNSAHARKQVETRATFQVTHSCARVSTTHIQKRCPTCLRKSKDISISLEKKSSCDDDTLSPRLCMFVFGHGPHLRAAQISRVILAMDSQTGKCNWRVYGNTPVTCSSPC